MFTHSNQSLYTLRTTACLLALAVATTACFHNDDSSTDSNVSAQIGPLGGTLTAKDGTEVVIPAGALADNTTLSIKLSSAGAPALPDDLGASPIYEFTPHDVVFNKPVTLRMPVPAGADGTQIMMASPGGEWQAYEATVTHGIAQWQRNSFSWGLIAVCTPSNKPPYSSSNPDPYPCSWPSGAANASATPTQAITRVEYGSMPGNATGIAGSWRVSEASTVHLTMHYRAAPDCENGHVKLIRWNPTDPLNTANRVQTLFDQGVALTQTTFTIPGSGSYVKATGSTTVDVALTHLDNGTRAYGFNFSCNRPYRTALGGGDLITLVADIPAPSVTYTIGGTVSGLTGSGLVLQNNGGDNLAISADGAFTFATAIAANAPYNVTVSTQPSGQTCSVVNGSSTAVADVSNVTVSCATGTGPQPLLARSLAAGYASSLVAATDGTVWAWGQYVDPTTGGYKSLAPWATTPVQVQGLSDVMEVALSSETHSYYALHGDGTVSAWGVNDTGQLGDRTTITRNLPVKVMQNASTVMDEVCAMAATNNLIFMARQTGCSPGNRVVASGPWVAGWSSMWNIGGDSSSMSTTDGALAKAVPGWPSGQIVAGMYAVDAANTSPAIVFITGSSSYYLWGYNGGNRLGMGGTETAGSSAGPALSSDTFWNGVERVEIGVNFSIGIDGDSQLRAVGRNVEGQLGDGTSTDSDTWVSVLNVTNVSDFSVGQANAAAITAGQLWAWGDWNGSFLTQPTRIGTGTGFYRVSVGDIHGLVTDSNDAVYSWGASTDGALGRTGSGSVPAVVLRP